MKSFFLHDVLPPLLSVRLIGENTCILRGSHVVGAGTCFLGNADRRPAGSAKGDLRGGVHCGGVVICRGVASTGPEGGV